MRFIQTAGAAFILFFLVSGCFKNPLSDLSSSQKDMKEIEGTLQQMLDGLGAMEGLLSKVQKMVALLEEQKKKQDDILRVAQEQEKWVTLSGSYNTNVYRQMRFMHASFQRQGKTIKQINDTSFSLKNTLADAGQLNVELKEQIKKAIELSP